MLTIDAILANFIPILLILLIYRSRMNVPFILADKSRWMLCLLQESEAAGLRTLAGHRSVGGMRASIYNAMPMEGIQALIELYA